MTVPAAASPSVVTGGRLPVVEDDDAIAEPLQEGLEREGFSVRRVRTGAEPAPWEGGWTVAQPVSCDVAVWWSTLVAVELTSLLMRHLSRRTWHVVHLTSYVLFWIATVHALTAGTDAGSVLFVVTVDVAVTLVVFLSLVRVLSPRAGLPKAARPAAA